MAAVYRRGEGAVYRAVRRWLAAADQPTADEELVACACHALGNFATNDDHALAMVRAGVHRDLVTPLTSDSIRLQMAALSLLRNLSLPAENKMALLEAGLLGTLLGLCVVEQPVLFKYYGTLRLLAGDSGAACGELASRPGLLRQLAADGCRDGPYGVQHEAARLLARVVRTARSEVASRAVIEADGHGSLVRLLQSDSAIMVNEAIMALCLTAPHTPPQLILSSEFVPALSRVMTQDSFPVQVRENAVTLLQLLRSKEDDALRESLRRVPQPDLSGTVDR
ncbi:vacuolar protein 8-like [Pollicipes pollicipes]|uniref:vacuolar protein 8-like n=1 Tax=Pollicipes pollicipes TaxID=41117 RepID=UPI001884BADC|nr:vacuolar protein 8-like [Pollicipes pollicipes]